MIRKEPSPKAGYVRVTFEIPASLWANRVYLVGDFNDWSPSATPFECCRDGVWRVILDLPARRRYEFRYLIDDCWWTDYHANSCTKSGFETLNSVVETTLPLVSLAGCTGHGMVHEAALDRGMDAGPRRHLHRQKC